MASISHVWALCSLLLFVETCLSAYVLQEQGSKTTIGCAFKKYEPKTTWQVRAGHDFINVTSCTFGQNICVDRMPQQFRGEVVNSSDGFTSRLIINNARINETEFRCLSRYGFASNTLELYARPSNPVCDPVELDYTKKILQFRCKTTKVFPSVSALLYIRGEDVHSGHCSNEDHGSLAMDGYSAECVWRVSAAKLEPVKYKYYVKVFPNLSNSTGISVPTAVSQDYTLQLSSPAAVIDYSHCPVGSDVVDGKILTGSTASCRCVLESPGFPSGQARWYTLHGNQSLGIDDIADGSSTLEIYSNTPGKSYQCRAESPLNNPLNWGPVYTPVFTTPSSDHETYSLRIEIVAGILAGSVGLTVIISLVIWKWRSSKRQNADKTTVVYSKPIVETESDSGKPECSGNYDTLLPKS